METLQRERAVREANSTRGRTSGGKAGTGCVSEAFLDDTVIIPFVPKEG